MENLHHSDCRIIKSIYPISSLLSKIEQIQFISYDYIDKNIKPCEFGVIAQELITIFPNMVHTTIGVIPNANIHVEHKLISDDLIFITFHKNKLNENDVIQIHITPITHTTPYIYNTSIIHCDEMSIKIKKWDNYSPTDHIIVYGVQLDDLHYIDASQFSILATACVKELHQIVQKQNNIISYQQTQINTLLSNVTELQKQVSDVILKHE